MSKKRSGNSPFVYSTDPSFRREEENVPQQETLPNAKQPLRIWLDKKQRAGKAVTLVDGFHGSDDALETLGKNLKSFCGTGGSVKDGVILIQGDQRDKILQWLLKNGYNSSKKAGG
jgi:translation initiation factor 1